MLSKPKMFSAMLLILCQPAIGALIVTNSYEIEVVGAGILTDASPSDPATASINLNNNLGTADANAESLTLTNLNGDPDSFSFTAQDFASASVDRQSGQGNQSPQGGARAEYTIQFELGINETATASFDLDFVLNSNTTIDPVVSWSLTGPGSTPTSISGSSTTSGTSGLQTAALSTAGIYTLTITAEVPLQGLGSNREAIAELTNLTFTIDAVPEPSSSTMLGIGLTGLIWRKKRTV